MFFLNATEPDLCPIVQFVCDNCPAGYLVTWSELPETWERDARDAAERKGWVTNDDHSCRCGACVAELCGKPIFGKSCVLDKGHDNGCGTVFYNPDHLN